MNLQFISWDDLNAIKENLDQYVSKFAQPSNAWIEEELGHSPFLNTKYPMPDIHLDMSQPMDKAYLTDAANVQEFYGKLSFISDSQASDERLWAGLCLGPFYEYTQYRWKIALKCTKQDIKAHYFFGFGARRSLSRNALARLWWIGRLTYDDSRPDPYELTKFVCEYGYLPKRLKKLVDEIVDEMERLPGVSRCYDRWLLLQGKVAAYYHDKPQERIPLSQQKEFRQIKNAVIQEAERLHLGEIGFEEKGLNQQDEPEEYRNASYDYWTLRDEIRDESLTMEERGEAVSEMERLAESGDMYAQYLMGKLWRDGPLLIPDSVEARYWFEQAADQGHLVAQYSLAKLYLSDDLEVRDTRKGMNWLYTAAVNGSHYAMYRLAKECLKGEHIQKDTARAVEWFAKSAEGGNPYAQYMLGKLYLTGTEAPYDEERAIHWLTRSAEQGNQYAQYLLNHLEENRPPSAMLAVTRLLHHMSRVFRDNSVPKSRPGGIQIDRKRLKKLQEKRMALGHKLDDHEEQWPDLTM